MCVRQILLGLYSLILLIGPSSLVRGAEQNKLLTPERAQSLAIRLGSTNDQERVAAANELKAIGPSALVPVLRQVGNIKQKDVKLIARIAACRVLAFGNDTNINRLTTCDEKLKIHQKLLDEMAHEINGNDVSNRQIAIDALGLLCFTTNGTAVGDLRAALKETKPDQVDKILQAAVVMHAQSVISTVTQLVKPGPKVKMVPLDAYEDQLKAIARYGKVSKDILVKLSENAERAYREWEQESKRIALLGDDEDWQECVATGSMCYTLKIVFGQMVKKMNDSK